VTDPSSGEPPDAIAQLVHDLRQPLSVLRLLVERVQGDELPDELATVVSSIAAQVDEAIDVARRLSRLVE
jgi:signal transduction histidine kinase